MRNDRLFNWFFYGHIQIALAAAGLCWLSLRISHGEYPVVNEIPVITFVFFSTFGVYTLHRYLSFQRAGTRPTAERYNIVAHHPRSSLIIGIFSLLIAGIIGLPFTPLIWPSLAWAIPITFFYLTPPIKGWKRLRDIPFIKVVWVGIAWQIMTHEIPVRIVSELIYDEYSNSGLISPIRFGLPGQAYAYEALVRTLFTICIAIVFDYRDVILDKSQKVKTIASQFPVSGKIIVSVLMGIIILLLLSNHGYPEIFSVSGSLSYLMVIMTAWLTHEKRSERWYAVMVNGLLLAPVMAMVFTLLIQD